MTSFVIHTLINASIYALLALSLNLQFGLTGLPNFGHVLFFAVGAYVSAILFEARISPWIGWLVAVGMGVMAGWLISQPVRRLKPEYWALATLGAAEIFRLIMQNEPRIAGGSIGVRGIPPIADPPVFAAIMVSLVLVTLMMNEHISRSAFGRTIRVIREDETMAAALGRNVYSAQVRVMMLGGAIAALSGFAYAHYISFVSPEGFLPIETFFVWTMVILGGRGNNLGAIFGAVVLVTMSASTRFVAEWSNVSPTIVGTFRIMIFGLLLVGLVLFRQKGIFPERKRIYHLSPPILGNQGPLEKAFSSPRSSVATASSGASDGRANVSDSPIVRIERVSKRFGGIQALKDVTLEIPRGRVTGLIGPNGSGKSTLFNVISGVEPLDSGRIFLDENRIDNRRPDLVARQGIVRTFQIPKVARQLTVLENLLFARMGQQGEFLTKLFTPGAQVSLRQENESHLKEGITILELLDLHHMANEYTGNLSGGQLKLLSVGLVLMANPHVMLLDEPTAGVNPILIRRIMYALAELRTRGHTLFIIEHNMQVIAQACEHVYVLNSGQIIANGSPDEVRLDPAVIAAYLGTSAA
jgi:ABC-type branched-subunit amino acid transport system ATPase component/ABC-type branched-subunit amino acid transport system permease subunit